MSISRAALHYGEEPCISGTRGSGTVFFTGCSMHCVFCQNDCISLGGDKLKCGASAYKAEPEELREIFFMLIEQGAHNINLVTPTHFTDKIIEALGGGLPVPVVWNSSGYETVETLKRLEGLVQIYMPDFKYSSPLLAEEYSGARDYPEIAEAAIREMIRQTGPFVIGEDGLLLRGTLVRHLVLPRAAKNTRGVIDAVSRMPQNSILFSLMAQYTPREGIGDIHPELAERITDAEYESAVEYLELSGIENAFIQELSSADESFIPAFDGTGVTKR